MSQSSVRGTIKTDKGALKELLTLYYPTTVQHGYEVLRDQMANTAERNLWYYTADTSAFGTRGTVPVWYFGNGYTKHPDPSQRILINPVFAHIQEAYDSLVLDKGGVFIVPTPIALSIPTYLENPIDLNGLRIITETPTSSCGYIKIPTNKHERSSMSQEELSAARWALSGGKDLDEVLEQREFEAKKPFSVALYTLTPEFVLSRTQHGELIARTCKLWAFDHESRFDAHERFVEEIYALRGIPRTKAAESAEAQVNYASLVRALGDEHFNAAQFAEELKPHRNALRKFMATLERLVSPKL